ncbi:uncharacterized protein TRIADDRAFT_23458 [Trichoplax adhaerens]|uniref:GPI transamidase component PIG-T n=1 Tax=Trichoplax adhaerens TaxID=10228 RepID=B3RVN0_TRIAD|nr:hypothetical protein TRIADDRAFT_23458 [Trichoplax adhaerens]EDV26025.1 hypothetical protein TRIADDRAFT_23458 [Trichoplax adhaerens]|eukprot:XP_002112058.1 hypothetical protein TRIADDRAFT_23458 [Trichoplax adhaerens]
MLVDSITSNDHYHEELVLKPLATGHLYAHFQFTTYWHVDIANKDAFKHFNLFPKPLGQILSRYDVEELHFSLTQGLWRHNWWGYPILSSPPGAELSVWFAANMSQSIDSAWSGLTNALSGLFCASLNFIDSTTTVSPAWSFRPEGASKKNLNSSRLRYAVLTRETICTENLTPWKKLLPCDAKAGLSVLFHSLALYNVNYHSMGVHVRPFCKTKDCKSSGVELKQTLSLVFNPIIHSGSRDWNLENLFSKAIPSVCPLATTSKIFVDISNNKTYGGFLLKPLPHSLAPVKPTNPDFYAVYDLNRIDFDKPYASHGFNLAMEWLKLEKYGRGLNPPLDTHRYATGLGDENGGIRTRIYNHDERDINILYMEVVPWFFRLYLHTFEVLCSRKRAQNVLLNRRFIPGKDRSRPYLLELALRLPAKSSTTIKIDFQRAFLKWTEHPPDAHHGFYISSAVITTVLLNDANTTVPPLMASNRNHDKEVITRLYTEALLVTLPTPDFSMPFIVICLTSTVVAIAFGSIHNLTTRQYQLKNIEDIKKQSIFNRLISLVLPFKKK